MVAPVAIRAAREDETARLIEFEASFAPDPATMRRIVERNERAKFARVDRVVAEVDGEIVGLGLVGSAELMGFGEHTSQVRVYVREEQRRHGLGTALLRELERSASSRGRDVVVGLSSAAAAGLAFFARHGYEEARRQQRWLIDVAGARLDQFERPEAIAAAAGARLLSYAEARPALGADLESAVGTLHGQLVSEMPAPLRPARMRIAEYREVFLGERILEGASVLALKDGALVGMALLERATKSTAFARVIGAIGAARAKRLPLALKLEVIARLRRDGYESLLVQDDQDNAPLRRILRGLGAEEVFAAVTLRKRLR